MKRSRRVFLACAGSSAALTTLPRFAAALDYPTRAVHIVVGFAAGLSPDILGRLIAQALSERLNQQFIVDNRPGAASNIGTEVAAHAGPDGYTVLLTISGNAINATLYASQLRFCARSNARRCHRPHAFRDRGQSCIPRQIRSRIDRICEVKSWQDKHCFGWAGNWTTCRLRAVQDDDRCRYGPGAV